MNGSSIVAPHPSVANLYVRETDALHNNLVLSGYCNGAPDTTANIYSHGCLLIQLDTATGAPALWQNVGSSAAPSWSLLDTSVISPDTLAYNSDATAGPLTIAAAKMVDAILDRDGGATDRSDVTDTATNLLAAIPNAVVGTAFYFYLRNISATPGQKITLTAGSGVTLSGVENVYAGGSVIIIGRITATGTPAVTLYAVSDAIGALLPAVDAASSVNTIKASTAATTVAPSLTAVGSDAAIGLKLTPKGAGVLGLNGPVVTPSAINYIATESGANNAAVAALVDADGVAVPVVAGLKIALKLGHTLQAGANTLNLNTHGTDAIKSHNNPANNIGTAYASGSIVEFIFDGTVWQDLSQ